MRHSIRRKRTYRLPAVLLVVLLVLILGNQTSFTWPLSFLRTKSSLVKPTAEQYRPNTASPQQPLAFDAVEHSSQKLNKSEGGESDLIIERIRWFQERHPQRDPDSRLAAVKEEYEERQWKKRVESFTDAAIGNWVSLGPTNGAGRISSIAVHPTVNGTVYVGSDGGGVWKTTDAGTTWISLTDSINNLNVGAVAIAPSSSNIVYVGTGSEHASGIGLLKSIDGGNNWSFPANVIASRFFRISVHPTNPLELVAATSSGALRSTDGGNTWNTVIPSNPYFNITDLKRDPTNPLILYATARTTAGGRILKSTNGGISFTEKMAGVANNTDSMSIAITPANPLVLYVLTSIQSDLSHIYKSTDGGESWTDLPSVYNSTDVGTRRLLGSQAWHDNTIIVSPVNPNIVIAGGVGYRRSTDGGQTWSQPFCGNFSCFYVHVDWTDQQYQGTTLWIANDGGVYKSPDDGNTATEHNNGLVVREFYAMSNHPVLLNSALAGSQDNGTDFRYSVGGTSWFSMPYCDGFDSAVNPQRPYIAYATCQGGDIRRTQEFGTNPNIFSFPPAAVVSPPYASGETRPFATRLIMDSSSPSTLYTVSSSRVWKTTNDGDSWTPLSTSTTDGSTLSQLLYVAVAKSNSNVLMTWNGSTIYRSTDGGTTWTKKPPLNYPVTSLDIDPIDPNVIYIGSYSGCSGCSGVLMSTDGGNSWQPRGTGLPGNFRPTLAIRVDPLDSNTVYCGTSSAVYVSSDRGLHWSDLGTNLPSVYIEDLSITDDGSSLRAATYGRGIWEIQLRNVASATVGGGVLDGSGNGVGGVTLSLSTGGTVIATFLTTSNGTFSFGKLARHRNYIITASKQNTIFNPQSVSLNNLNSDQIVNFSTGSSSVPPPPIANAAAGVTTNGFTANWASSSGANGYRLDVSTNASFSSFLSGYQNLDLSNSSSRSVTGLTASTLYYYRLRAYNAAGTSGNSNTITVSTLGPSIFIEQASANRASALDSVTWVKGPFRVLNFFNFSTDNHTRVILFTSDLGMTQPDASQLTVRAGGVTLTVEGVGPVAGVTGMNASYVVVRLPDGLPVGDLPLVVTLRSLASVNSPTLAIASSGP